MVVEMEHRESALTARASAMGVEIGYSLGVEDIRQSNEDVTIRAGGEAFRSRWLVGCDGGRSTVRKAGGFEFVGTDWFLSGDRRHCRLLETYADTDAVVAQLSGPVAQEFVPKVLAVATLNSFEVYGDPGPKASAMLAAFGAAIFAPWHVF